MVKSIIQKDGRIGSKTTVKIIIIKQNVSPPKGEGGVGDKNIFHCVRICGVGADVEQVSWRSLLRNFYRSVIVAVFSIILVYRIYHYSLPIVVVVALLFYVHDKHLRSCRDGQ